MMKEKKDWIPYGLLLLPVLFSIAFRMVGLGHLPGVNADELWPAFQTRELVHGGYPFWTTPSGRLLSPFYILLSIPFQAFFAPTIWAARAPAVVAGLLVLPLVFWLARRVIGRNAAWIATALIACLPLHIGFSRIGWEPSLMPLFAFLAIYFSLRGDRVLTLVTLVAAVINHVLAIFMVPALALPLIVDWTREKKLTRAQALKLVGRSSPVLLLIVWLTVHRLPVDWHGVSSGLLSRLYRVDQLGEFMLDFSRLLSGVTVIEGFAGPLAPFTRALFDWISGAVLLSVLGFGIRSLWRKKDSGKLLFIGSWFSSFLLFYLIAGPSAMQPGYERYPLYMGVPAALIVALCLTEWETRPERPIRSFVATTAFCGLLLLGFWTSYFGTLETTGGTADEVYRTAPVEPKWAAVQTVLEAVRDRAPGEVSTSHPLNLITDGWALYWPARYFLYGDARFQIYHIGSETPEPVFQGHRIISKEHFRSLMREGGYGIGFGDKTVARVFTDLYPKGSVLAKSFALASGQPWIWTFQLNPTFAPAKAR